MTRHLKLGRGCQSSLMRSDVLSYRGYRFPPKIISHAVWLYHRFCLSFRDAEDLLAGGNSICGGVSMKTAT